MYHPCQLQGYSRAGAPWRGCVGFAGSVCREYGGHETGVARELPVIGLRCGKLSCGNRGPLPRVLLGVACTPVQTAYGGLGPTEGCCSFLLRSCSQSYSSHTSGALETAARYVCPLSIRMHQQRQGQNRVTEYGCAKIYAVRYGLRSRGGLPALAATSPMRRVQGELRVPGHVH